MALDRAHYNPDGVTITAEQYAIIRNAYGNSHTYRDTECHCEKEEFIQFMRDMINPAEDSTEYIK